MEKFIVILVALLIPMAYLGRGLFYIDFILILIISLYFFIKNNVDLKFVKNQTLIFGISSFYFVSLLISFINPTHNYEINFKLLFCIPFFLVILIYLYDKSSKSLENFFLFERILYYSVSFVSLFVVLSFITDIDLINSIKKFDFIEYTHGLYHAKHNLFAILIVFFIYFVLKNKTLFNSFLFIIFILGVLSSHSRTGLITVISGILIYFTYSVYLSKKFNLKNFTFLFLFLVLGIFSFIYVSADRLNTIDDITSGRYEGWILFINHTIENGFFLGLGIESSFDLYHQKLLLFKHPHNILVEIFLNLGLVGLLWFLFISVTYIYKIINNNNNINKVLAFTTFVVVFINSQGIGGIWMFPNVMISLMLIVISSKIKLN